jgi:glycosyltransferase involved in cell wall biosynthesis
MPLTYVLVTPARNERAHIERTIRSVVRQTQLPVRWAIVSDGSSDGTDEIVKRHAAEFPWITYRRTPDARTRDFAGKVRAFYAGYQAMTDVPWHIVGNLDADVSVDDDDHFEFLLRQFAADPELGVAGTPFKEDGRQYDYRFTSIEHVSGACQLFRRECFEAIGGYPAIRQGGVDLVAVTTARMLGWKTRTFAQKACSHHRSIGTGSTSELSARFRFGRQDYYLGSHPLWEVCRSLYQLTRRPYVLGGTCLLCGYVWAHLRREARPVNADFIRFRRHEQMRRLRRFVRAER